MRQEVLIALLSKRVEEILDSLPQSHALRGPRGRPGRDGIDGKNGRDFVFEEHEETIRSWAKEFSLKFEDLTSEQIESLRGPRGRDGQDGRSFVFEEHEETIRSWAKEFALKFEDLTSEQIKSLRGPRGRDGKDGKDFSYEESKELIESSIRSIVNGIKDSLKLNFSDLTEEEISQLRGPRGRDGRDGRDFVFEDHIEFFKSLKPKFSDFTDEERASLVLKFNQLTEEEKSELKLKFSDLTDEEKISLRGPRGARGQKGTQGREGKSAFEIAVENGFSGTEDEWLKSLKGKQGVRGLPGPQGIAGISVHGKDGRDGRDGRDAPYVTDIYVDPIRADEVVFVFEFSDDTVIRSNPVKLPRSNVYLGGGSVIGVGGGGGGGEPGPPGPEGKSAYEVAVENGFAGTEEEWLASLKGDDGAQGQEGKSAYEVAVENGFVGTEEEWLESLIGPEGPEGPQGPPGEGDGALVQVLECEPSVYEGAAVRLKRSNLVYTVMSQWPNLYTLSTLDASTYDVVAANAQADTLANSNVIGIVEEKLTETTCRVRTFGPTVEHYFGLEIEKGYYLSDVYPGLIVPYEMRPSNPGAIEIKIGTPLNSAKLICNIGQRKIVS